MTVFINNYSLKIDKILSFKKDLHDRYFKAER
jgi:hypothetical protein